MVSARPECIDGMVTFGFMEGRDLWEQHEGIVRILSSDPAFDRSAR